MFDSPDMQRDPLHHTHDIRCALSALAPALQQTLESDYAHDPTTLDVLLGSTERACDAILRKIDWIESRLGPPVEPDTAF